MPIIDQSDKKDIVLLGNKDQFSGTFHVVHGKSGESASVTLNKLNDVKSGDFIGGDFNINFLSKKNVKALRDWLNEKKFCLEISEDALEQLIVYLKIRSTNSLYSQQLLKNGLIDIFIKDLPPFKVVENVDGRDPVPAALTEKLDALSAKAKDVESQITDPSDFAAINKLCKEHGVVSYHDLESSFGNDHPYSYVYDASSNTVVIIQNSIEHTDYDLAAHFKNPVDSNVSADLYLQLDGLVWSEFYKLLAKRDETPLSVWNSTHKLLSKNVFTRDEVNKIKAACVDKLDEKEIVKNNAKMKIEGPGSGTLSKEDISAFYSTVLQSKQLKQINALLKTPFDLDTAKGIEDRLAVLLSDKNMGKYKTKITGVLTAVYQALNTDFPKANEQTVALNGTGFLPFTRPTGEVIPATEIHDIQIKRLKQVMDEAHGKYPTAHMVLALIEGQEDGKKQQKCAILEQSLDAINVEAMLLRSRIDTMGKQIAAEFVENWNFNLTVGIVLSATASLAAFAVAALALAAIIAAPLAGIIALAAVGAVAGGLAVYGLFNYKEKINVDPEPECAPAVSA